MEKEEVEIKKVSRKQMLKKIKVMAKLTQRKKVYSKKTEKIKKIFKFVLFMSFIFTINFLSSYASEFLGNFITKSNEALAVAIIAIPVAMLGVFISVLMQQHQKYYNTRFMNNTLKDIYKNGHHYFDFYILILYWLFANFLLWLIEFINLNYAKMVIYALIMLADIIYLILFSIWKYKLLPSSLYLKNIMSIYFVNISDKEKENSLYDETKKLIDKNKMEETLKIIEDTYMNFFDQLDSLTLSIVSSKDNEEEKTAYIEIIKKIKKLKFKETNALISIAVYNKTTKLFNIMLEKKDYLFCKELIFELLDIWLGFISNYQDFCKKFIDFLKDLIISYDNLTIKENKKAYDMVQNYVKVIKTFLDILTLFEVKIKTTFSTAEKDDMLKDSLGDGFISEINILFNNLKSYYPKLEKLAQAQKKLINKKQKI